MQATYLHRFNGTLMNKIPLLKKIKLQTVGGIGMLAMEDNSFKHIEVFAGIEKPFKMWKQLFKFGVYYVAADSNSSKLNGQIKFGIDMYNSWSKSWSY